MSTSVSKQEILITGMTCGHCRSAVESAIREVPGVINVKVDLDAGTANVEGQADAESLVAAIEEAGYEAQASGN